MSVDDPKPARKEDMTGGINEMTLEACVYGVVERQGPSNCTVTPGQEIRARERDRIRAKSLRSIKVKESRRKNSSWTDDTWCVAGNSCREHKYMNIETDPWERKLFRHQRRGASIPCSRSGGGTLQKKKKPSGRCRTD